MLLSCTGRAASTANQEIKLLISETAVDKDARYEKPTLFWGKLSTLWPTSQENQVTAVVLLRDVTWAHFSELAFSTSSLVTWELYQLSANVSSLSLPNFTQESDPSLSSTICPTSLHLKPKGLKYLYKTQALGFQVYLWLVKHSQTCVRVLTHCFCPPEQGFNAVFQL